MKQKLLACFCLSLLLVFSAWAQDKKEVSGVVTDAETGEGVPGVNVIVKGTNDGAVTDVNGRYKIMVAEGATLVFKTVGMGEREVTVGAGTVLDVKLLSSTKELTEVVVTAIGIESDKRSLGYSIQSVKSEEIVNARETNLVNALNSKVAGVQVISSSGSPGSSANIRIRGATSITRGNSPLFVIDGVPISNTEIGEGVAGVDQSNRAIDINPNDIASLTVLKGPAATALYGIRAANGAIVVTTKKGQAGRPNITISSSITFDEVNRLPDMQQEYAQGIANTRGGGIPEWRGPETFTAFSWGPLIGDLEYDGSDYKYDPRGRLVPRGQGNGSPAQAFNNTENFFRTGVTADNNVSISGGNNFVKYYISAGHLTQTGIVPNADFRRTSFRANIDANITEKITVGASAGYIRSGGNRIQRGSNLRGVMLGLLRTTPTFDNGLGRTGQDAADFLDAYQFPDGSERSYRAGIYDNPYWVVNRSPSEDDVNRIIGNVSVGYQVLPWLKLSYKIGVDQFTDRRLGGIDRVVGEEVTWNAGSVFTRTYNSRQLNSDAFALINYQFSEDFSLNATIGHNYFETFVNSQGADGNELGVPTLFNLGNASSITAFETLTRRRVHGVFADIRLGWRNMLFLNFTGRNDWSSTLPENDNSFFYPSVSLGFVFSELIPENSVLSFGKLRLSYGEVGNDAPAYATNGVFVQASIDGDGFIDQLEPPVNGQNFYERGLVAPNPVIEAERTYTYEIGAELRFLNNRIGLDFTYYNSTSDGQIIDVDVSSTTGFTAQTLNAGEITNKGIEITLDATPVQVGDFRWDIGVNFTQYENDVESLTEGVERIFLAGFTGTSSNAIAGQPYGTIFGSRYQRDDAGNVIIGSNGWPLQASTDGPIGDPNPDFLMGIRNTFSWKGITVSTLIDIREGGDIWCGTCGVTNYFGTSQITSNERAVTGFVFPGVQEDGSPNTVPVDFANPFNPLGSNGYKWTRYGFGGIDEDNIFDGSWVRLRELTVAYTFPSTLFDGFFVKGLDVSFTARNLFVITDYPGIDPETNLTGATNGFGLEYFNMPNTRSYGFAVNLKL